MEFFAHATNHQELVNFHRVALNDQVEGKSLLGSYSCHEVPGQFTWTNGIITKAVINGDWLLIEDVDQAPPDVLSALEPLIQRRELHILSRGMVIRADPGFHLFMTSRSPAEDIKKLRLTKLVHQLKITEISQWSDWEMTQLLTSMYPLLNHVIPKMIAYFCNISEASNGKRDVRHRPVTIRDLIKWCARCCEKGAEAEDFVLEGLDCFCSHLGKQTGSAENATKLAHLFNVTSERMVHLLDERSPSLTTTKSNLKIGRVALKKAPMTKSLQSNLNDLNHRPYYLTRPASRLLEFIGMCIKKKEPVLIVGETGVGKTSAIQYLANSTNHQLVAVNLNQQTESCDLIGGIKPVNVEHYLMPVYADFEKAFSETFDTKQNGKFLAHLANCRSQNRWKDLVKLMLHTSQSAPPQAANWNLLRKKIEQVAKAVATDSRLYFAFIQGVLTTAITKGHWILLDEINMAESDVLDCVAELLNPDMQQLCVQGNEGQVVTKHPNFRVFACMNPSTDVGKKELNGIIRTRFTEYFIEEPYNDQDLRLIVHDYLKPLDITATFVDRIINFYKSVKKLARTTLMDGTGHQPTFSLRTLCRALNIAAKNPCQNSMRSIIEAFILCFLTEVDRDSYDIILALILKKIDKNGNSLKHPMPSQEKCIKIEGYWIACGGDKDPVINENYILTPSVRRNLKDISRVVSLSNFAVLLQGETSVGKTSMITYLAEATGNTCIRVNNHEHTDVQEYLGSYVVNEKGVFVFQEGVLPMAMRKGFWIILDELNLAPTDVLEALNRVLDDNRELFIPETQTLIKAHPNFRLFATQNPSGTYGGRKPLSRAFRNRFVELHFSELPHGELSEIIEKRAGIARSQSVKLVQALGELQMIRRNSATFEGKYSFLTLRDLFRWAFRCSHYTQTKRFHDWEQHFAEEGYLVLTSRSRCQDDTEEVIIRQVLKKVFKREVSWEKIMSGATMQQELSLIQNPTISEMVWTSGAKRLALLILHSFRYNEPVLLVGETGLGKTKVCQSIANLLKRSLISVNCHLNTESSDFLGGLRPTRDATDKPFEWVDGPLVKAMETGGVFLIDEISLAEDGVLERLNSVLESDRSLYLMEQQNDIGDDDELQGVRCINSHANFQIVATMNPGGDFGKRELSPALRNRLVEIWCPSVLDRNDLTALMESRIGGDLTQTIKHCILNFIQWFDSQQVSRKVPFTTRDLVAWMTFIKDTKDSLDVWDSVIHGLCLVITDGLANILTGESLTSFLQATRNLLESNIPDNHSDCLDWILSQGSCQVLNTDQIFQIGPFGVPKSVNFQNPQFHFQSQTVARNAMKLLRGLQLKNSKALLLEGSPGVGKSSIVSAIASMTGNKLVRINLSEQTEISDLIGSDLPSEAKGSMTFEWHDGPLLAAMKSGNWVLLDELNLATQSVLEGLNACLDHRAEIFIPELNKTFSVDSKSTKIFATQNPPREGGERKNLPKSFLNRFVKVHMMDYTSNDVQSICHHRFADNQNLSSDIINQIVTKVEELDQKVKSRQFGALGSPWQFNLRDLMRFANGTVMNPELLERYLKLVFCQRFRTLHDQSEAMKIFGLKDDCEGKSFELSENEFKIGCASLARRNHHEQTHQDVQVHLSDYPIMESVSLCIKNNWLSIIVGEGKTEDLSRYVQMIAGVLGQKLHCLTLSSATDTSELLGGFEQTSSDIVLSNKKNRVQTEIANALETITDEAQINDLIKLTLTLEQCTDIQELKKVLKSIKSLEMICDAKDEDNEVSFEWIDSILVKAIEQGDWVLLSDANLCNPSVLDRLNSLMEENGSLAIGEKGCRNGQVPQVKPHSNFRLFLTMDPREGELSPAMRNRGIEIFVPSSSNNQQVLEVLNGEKIIRHDHSYLLLRQFSIAVKSFGFMGERCLTPFLSCDLTLKDWQERQLLIQKYLNSFKHPLEHVTKKDMFELLTDLELNALIKTMKSKKLSKQEIAKQLWQHFNNLIWQLKNHDHHQGSSSSWIAICQCSNLILQIGDSLADTFDDTTFKMLSVLWKNLKEMLKTIDFDLEESNVEAIEDSLDIKTNIFEPLAISFHERFRVTLDIPSENMNQIQKLTDLFSVDNSLGEDYFNLFPYLLERVHECQGLATASRQIFPLAEKMVANDNIMQLFEAHHECPTLVRDEYLSLLKMLLKSESSIDLNKASHTLNSFDKMSKILLTKKCVSQMDEDEEDMKGQVLAALNGTLPMSPNVAKIIGSEAIVDSSPMSLIKLGLLAIHVAAERSDIDIAEQMQIESSLKTSFKASLQDDILALDSCLALFPVQHEQNYSRPDQVQRKSTIAQLSSQIQDLELRQPVRQQDNYDELIAEVRKMHKNVVSLDKIQELLDDLKLASNESLRKNAVMKIQNWCQSLLPFMHKLPQHFGSYQDIWTLILWGCANLVIGMMQYKQFIALSWRQDSLKQFDQIRKISRFPEISSLTLIRDNLCMPDEKKTNVIQDYSAEVLSDLEQSLIKQIFQDHVYERKNELKNAYLKNIDMEKIITKIKDFVKKAFEIKDEEDMDEDFDFDPFVIDLLKSLDTCLTRSVFESKEKFMVPIERICSSITEWNKNAVHHQIIPLKDVQTLAIGWRKSLHEWTNICDTIDVHLKSGVQKCLDSFLPFLHSPNKTLESFCVPFILFCHNSFIGDFSQRIKQLQIVLKLLRYEEPDLATFLNTVIIYYGNFRQNVDELLAKKKRELKMQFEVQKKSSKRLYEETHIRDHFKAANNIARESSKKLEEVCLQQSRTHFNFNQFKPCNDENFRFQVQNQEEKPINQDLNNRMRNQLATRVQKIAIKIDLEDLDIWCQDVQILAKDLKENKAKKLTFHVVKTKASNMLTSLKEMGCSKSLGSSLDIQLFRVLQCLKTTTFTDSMPLLQSVFELEKLSSSMLLPITSKSKAYAFCHTGQDLLSHGNLILLELAQLLLKNQALVKKVKFTSADVRQEYDIFLAAKKCLAFIVIAEKLNPLPKYQKLKTWCMALIKSKSNPNVVQDINQQLKGLSNTDLHPNVVEAKNDLDKALDRFCSSLNKAAKNEQYPGVQDTFDASVKAQVKSCFLAIQTVLKRVQDLQTPDETQTFAHLIKKVINMLEILDLESFEIGIKSLREMANFCDDTFFQDQKFVFDAYLSVWSSIYNFANKIYSKGCEYTCHCAQAFKIILDYQYSEGKDQDEEQDSKDDGQAQDGCGLGDGDGGEATTKDVESEDIFESAERPQPQNDEKDDQLEEQEPRKEEDGFEVDNVEDENPQAPSDNENDDQNESEDEENEDKEQELDAEEGKADENVDDDFWDNEQEEEHKENDDKEDDNDKADSKEEKAGHEQDDDKIDDKNQKPEIEEDENKRQRKDEQFDEDKSEEIEMNDETYGQNEPPEPEDLEMGDDDEIMEDDNDKGDDENELPPEEDLRLPDFEETPDDEHENDDQEKQEITKSTGGNAGQDEAKPEEPEEQDTEQMDQLEDPEAEDKGKEVPNNEKNEDTKNENEGMISNEIEQQKDEDKLGKDEQNQAKEDDEMVTEEVDETKDVPISDELPNDEDEDTKPQTIENQEFAKDKKNDKNSINALDAMDVDDKPEELQKIKERDNVEQQRDGKSLDMSKLKDAITVNTENVERNTDTIFGRTEDQSAIQTEDADHEMLALEDIQTNIDDSASKSEDVLKWMQLTAETSELNQNLTEQLRLILEATKATRFKGDYKSGKRINMRKVIPFIASNYRKDKIWLRRTKPSKREYNIIVAVDDSTSMRVHNVNQIVDKSLAILCQTLSSLEVGKFGLVKFGKETEIVHHLQVRNID